MNFKVQEKPFDGDFSGGIVVKNLPSKVGDMGSIPGWGTKMPHAEGQLSPYKALCTTRECVCHSCY